MESPFDDMESPSFFEDDQSQKELKSIKESRFTLDSNNNGSLNLNDLDMRTDGSKIFCETLNQDFPLTSLQMCDCRITPQGLEIMLEILKKHKNLSELIIDANGFGDEGCKSIANLLDTGIPISVLGLDYNKIKSGGIKVLAKSLQCSSITELDLEGNHIDEDSCYLLYEAFKNNTFIQSLTLQDNPIDDEACVFLGELLMFNSSITYLDLSNCHFEKTGFGCLCQGLADNKTLEMLELDSNNFHDGAEFLKSSLEKNNTLLNLSMRNCVFSEIDWEMLADTIRTTHTLETLSLDNTRITHASVATFFLALAYNDSLQELSFFSSFPEKSWKSVEFALATNKSIKSIDLGGNDFGEFGAQCVFRGLTNNKSITRLHIDGNEIGHQGVLELTNYLHDNNFLRFLGFGHIEILGEDRRLLVKALKSNSTLLSIDLSAKEMNVAFENHDVLEEICKKNREFLKMEKEVENTFVGHSRLGSYNCDIEINVELS